MARACNFDRNEKLVEAMQLFWQKGYAATSIADLVEHLGINRFSLYNTFGDKQRLYHEALTYYLEKESLPKLASLLADQAGFNDVINFIEKFAKIQQDQEYGCFMQNALLEKCLSDEVVFQEGSRLFEQIVKTLNTVLSRSKQAGQISAEVDPARLSQFLLMQMQGIRVLGKAKQYEMIDNALAMLKDYLNSLKVEN
ncbi:TetR/AcrR family transcriptional regulator [Endozoicomonas sp. SM1973]|uniref:TetR/AcrR family transcriptional regulator n=1 Tax=Spartinivicinus marinus TaxID=2994442 RepID=A0A853I945_9GAMM|nr:TetR/AcrR family transcriptional regulator [Spartinivicinus marinus]MCX4025782.1 TetR/AcrR family transcriptional regulator [Spartinivicinus marinus]NYZ65775.1 TetR/AcrR family transcriptional regulator [Spartinivicinus marinus]